MSTEDSLAHAVREKTNSATAAENFAIVKEAMMTSAEQAYYNLHYIHIYYYSVGYFHLCMYVCMYVVQEKQAFTQAMKTMHEQYEQFQLRLFQEKKIQEAIRICRISSAPDSWFSPLHIHTFIYSYIHTFLFMCS